MMLQPENVDYYGSRRITPACPRCGASGSDCSDTDAVRLSSNLGLVGVAYSGADDRGVPEWQCMECGKFWKERR